MQTFTGVISLPPLDSYIQISFHAITQEQKEILIAELSESGFEGFEETDMGLNAFIKAKHYHGEGVLKIAGELKTSFAKSTIGETNWNQLWESGFEPVNIGNFACVRAKFHEPMKGMEHDIVITPKMSFGTGHHATSQLMIEQMRGIDFRGKSVLDFGTGTGILSILAEKLGAGKIIAIDHDDWSIANARENILENNCRSIVLRKQDSAGRGDRYDIILANINKNVILENLENLAAQLRQGGIMLLGGLLQEDENDVFRRIGEYSLQILQKIVKDNWLCLRLSC